MRANPNPNPKPKPNPNPKAWGLSNETSFGVGAFAAACARLGVAPPVSIQNDFSLCFRTFEGELAEACSPDHHNLALLAYGVLNGGILSGKYLGARHPALANATKAAAPPAPEPRARFNFVASDEVGMPDYQVSRTRTETLSLSLTLTRWVRAACPASRWHARPTLALTPTPTPDPEPTLLSTPDPEPNPNPNLTLSLTRTLTLTLTRGGTSRSGAWRPRRSTSLSRRALARTAPRSLRREP